MFVAVLSAKSCGVTTVSLALAAAAAEHGQSLLAELDPSGGDVECWTESWGEPGWFPAISDLRRDAHPDKVLSYAREVVPGVPALLAPVAGSAARSLFDAASAGRAAEALASLDALAVGDCGRWSPAQVSSGRLAGADVGLLVCRPDASGVEHTRHLLGSLAELVSWVGVVTLGDKPYGPAAIADAFAGTESVAPRMVWSLPWDEAGLLALLKSGRGRSWSKSRLARAADVVLGEVVEVARGSDVVG